MDTRSTSLKIFAASTSLSTESCASQYFFIIYPSRHVHDELLDQAYEYQQAGLNILIYEKLSATLSKLRSPNQATFETIVTFLRKVAKDCEMNKMTVENLAVVLAPTLMRLPTPMTQVIIF